MLGVEFSECLASEHTSRQQAVTWPTGEQKCYRYSRNARQDRQMSKRKMGQYFFRALFGLSSRQNRGRMKAGEVQQIKMGRDGGWETL